MSGSTKQVPEEHWPPAPVDHVARLIDALATGSLRTYDPEKQRVVNREEAR